MWSAGGVHSGAGLPERFVNRNGWQEESGQRGPLLTKEGVGLMALEVSKLLSKKSDSSGYFFSIIC